MRWPTVTKAPPCRRSCASFDRPRPRPGPARLNPPPPPNVHRLGDVFTTRSRTTDGSLVMGAKMRGVLRNVARGAVMLLMPLVAHATTVRRAPLDELVRDSHVIVRAHVSFIDERAGEASGKFLTRIGFEVDEAVMGLA